MQILPPNGGGTPAEPNKRSPRPTRAIVITAAVATSVRRQLEVAGGSPAMLTRLDHELTAPTFNGLEDVDLAVLMQQLELELHKRGWRPQREWRRREASEAPPA